jgi:hypothetical protein
MHDIQLSHVVQVLLGLAAAKFVPGRPELLRLSQDVIVDIGDILDVRDVVAARAKEANQDVERQKCEGVAGMCRVIGCHAADVDSDVVADYGQRLY